MAGLCSKVLFQPVALLRMQALCFASYQREQTPVLTAFRVELLPRLKKMLQHDSHHMEAIADDLCIGEILPDQLTMA